MSKATRARILRRSGEESSEWGWPFSLSMITAGLRRHLSDTSVQVEDVVGFPLPHRRPSIGRIRGLHVSYASREGRGSVRLVLKEPLGTTRAGLAGAGRREVGVYQSLASHLPLRTPALIAGSNFGDWLIMELIPGGIEPEEWSSEDYLQAIEGLAGLHDRFWNLGQDLDAFAWLSRPQDIDFEVHLTAARQALERLESAGRPAALIEDAGRMLLLETLIRRAEDIVAPLQEEPATLLHGDYWPGNIVAGQDGGQVVFDWQLAAVGPGVLDLLTFVVKSEWWFEDLPLDPPAMIQTYRDLIKQKTGVSWSELAWKQLWDHALMWRFLQEWLDLIAATPEPLLATRAQQLERIWLGPLGQALDRL
jgi:hypothetical protein